MQEQEMQDQSLFYPMLKNNVGKTYFRVQKMKSNDLSLSIPIQKAKVYSNHKAI